MLYSRQTSAITPTIPDDLAERLRNHQERLPEILEFGLREPNAGPPKDLKERPKLSSSSLVCQPERSHHFTGLSPD